MEVMRVISKEKPLLRNMYQSQSNSVDEWNSKAKECYSLFIPHVSSRDEIKTNGYGMAIIELLCLSEILIHTVSDMTMRSWYLVND